MGQAESSSLCYNACTDAEVDSEGRRPRPRARGSSLPSGFAGAQLAPGAHMRRKRDFPHSEADAPPISNQLLTALAARESGDMELVPLVPDGNEGEHDQKGNAGRDALLKVGALPAFQDDALNVSTMMGPMGFLLDQPEAYGPIYIAEVDEEGTARKLLKHPSIMLFEGDQILEVDVRMRVSKRRCSSKNRKLPVVAPSSASLFVTAVHLRGMHPHVWDVVCIFKVLTIKRHHCRLTVPM